MAIHVATIPIDLDLAILDRVLGGVEAALRDFGAVRVWIAPDAPQLTVLAELPGQQSSGEQSPGQVVGASTRLSC